MAAQRSSRLADQRARAGYTQESFAEHLGVDRTTVGRWERGVQVPQPWQRPEIAKVLSLTLDALDDVLRDSRLSVRCPNDDEPDLPREEDTVHACIPRLRRALDLHDAPADGPTRPLGQLTEVVRQMTDHRLESRYDAMTWVLPDLVTELSRAARLNKGKQQIEADRLLVLAYRAADGMVYKYGYLDLSARIVDLMVAAARRADSPLLVATASYVRTETFFATGDLATAATLLDEAAGELVTAGLATTPAVAAYGALHMRAAVVAARTGKADLAWDHLAEARHAAAGLRDDVYDGTAFGPSSVRVHELAVAAELRDGGAVARAGSWAPPRQLPAERRSHYYIDLAGAQLDLRQHDDACRSLRLARRIAPQHTREHPRVRRSLTRLVRDHPAPNSDVLSMAAWARAR